MLVPNPKSLHLGVIIFRLGRLCMHSIKLIIANISSIVSLSLSACKALFKPSSSMRFVNVPLSILVGEETVLGSTLALLM